MVLLCLGFLGSLESCRGPCDDCGGAVCDGVRFGWLRQDEDCFFLFVVVTDFEVVEYVCSAE